MKKMLVSLFVLASSLSQAGIIENKKTGEMIDLRLDAVNRTVEVLTTSTRVGNKIIKLHYVNQKKSNVRVYGLTADACEEIWWDAGYSERDTMLVCLLLPGANVPGLIVGAVETMALPVKLPMNLIQNSIYKKDFKLLMRAINRDQVIEVSNNRFRRIEEML
jgi:hypothetical protein